MMTGVVRRGWQPIELLNRSPVTIGWSQQIIPVRLKLNRSAETATAAIRWLVLPSGKEIAQRDLATTAKRAYPTLSRALTTVAVV